MPGLAAAQSRIDTRTDPLAERAPGPRAPERAPGPRVADRALSGGAFLAAPSFGTAAPAAPPVELAPRPDRSLEGPRGALAEEGAGIRPTIINPAIPGNGMAAEGMVNRRERRFLETPAAGARFSAPVTW